VILDLVADANAEGLSEQQACVVLDLSPRNRENAAIGCLALVNSNANQPGCRPTAAARHPGQ
jgi:hypothetical protein